MHACHTPRISKTSSSKSDSLMETEGDYSFAGSGSKLFLRFANVRHFLTLQFQQIPNLSSPFSGFLIHFTIRLKLKPVLLKLLIPRPLQGENHFSKLEFTKKIHSCFTKMRFFLFFWSFATNCLRGFGSEIPNSVYCFLLTEN